MKRILAGFLAILFCFVSVSVFAEHNSIVIALNDVNCARGGDQTILYNHSGTTTGTNMWGYEITVTDGIVTAVGGNDNIIPEGENSFVVSAHGAAMDALYGIRIGMTAEYNASKKTVTFTIDKSINKARINLIRNELLKLRNKAENGCYIIADNAEAGFAAVESKYNLLGDIVTEAEAESLINEYELLKSLYFDRAVSEYRAVWVNPTQKTYAEVEGFVRKCARAGLNAISLETFFDCTTICPMPEGYYFEQNPYFEGFDVLGAYVEACHKYNMELHCWMHVFAMGDPASVNYSKSLAYKKPEWCLVTNKSEYSKSSLNPALPEVRNALISQYRYILENYNIDAFELDYIRYAEVTEDTDYGYDDTTIERFKKKYPKYADTEITYDKSKDYWEDFVSFRNDCVTELVRDVRSLIDSVAPDVMLSADVGSVLWATRYSTYQDPGTWMQNGYLDIIHPMAYSNDEYENVGSFFNHTQDTCLVVPALGTYLDGSTAETMLTQACGMVDIGCYGVGYFAEQEFFEKNCDALLCKNLYTLSSISPTLNGANSVVAEINRFIERLQMPAACRFIERTAVDRLENSAKTILDLLETEKASSVSEELSVLKEHVTAIDDCDLKERLLNDVQNAINAARLKPDDLFSKYIAMNNSLPASTIDATQLTIDMINSPHRGEDSVLITDPNISSDYNVNFAYVMLLRLEDSKKRLYTVVETRRNWGSFDGFGSIIEENMIVISFHSNDIGSGASRRDLAQTIRVGTTLALWGINPESYKYDNLNSLLYVTNALPISRLDVNGDGKFNVFDYIAVKNVCLNGSTDANLTGKSDVNRDGKLNMFDYIAVKSEYFRQTDS